MSMGAGSGEAKGGGWGDPRPTVGGGSTVGITAEEAGEMRDLCFGDKKRVFTDAWKKQGFFFCEDENLKYGLIQVSE